MPSRASARNMAALIIANGGGLDPNRRFSCVGKQVLRDHQHYAVAINDAAAFRIAMSLNRLEREPLEPSA